MPDVSPEFEPWLFEEPNIVIELRATIERLRSQNCKAKEALKTISHLAYTGGNYRACVNIRKVARTVLEDDATLIF